MQSPSLSTALWPFACVALATSGLVSALLILSRRWHLAHTADSDFSKPQRIHTGEVPRIGGIAILAGLIAGMGCAAVVQPDTRQVLLWWMLGLAPVAGVGLVEDLTQRIRPRIRLLWMLLGSLAWLLGTGYWLQGLGVPGVDVLMAWPVVGVCFSLFACLGAINAYNIIDGLNGLMAGVAGLSLLAIAIVAAQVGDALVLQGACCLALSLLGWLPFNWPRARLFAGDGGAYCIGFITVTLLFALVTRNPAVSPWFGLTAAALPVAETLYSMWRRFRTGMHAMEPDQSHLHQLMRHQVHWNRSRRLMHESGLLGHQAVAALRRSLHLHGELPARAPNGSVSPMLWSLHGVAALLGVLLHDNTIGLIALCLVFGVVYVVLHRKLDDARDRVSAVGGAG